MVQHCMPKGINGSVAVIDGYLSDMPVDKQIEGNRRSACIGFDVMTADIIRTADQSNKIS